MENRQVSLTSTEQKIIWETLTREGKRIQEKINSNNNTSEYWSEQLEDLNKLLKRFDFYLKPRE